jgi:hypothetical protein
MKELPSNMTLVHHRGSRSFVDTFYRDVKDGFANGHEHCLIRKIASDGEQLSEEDFKTAFDIAITFAQAHLGVAQVNYARYDLESKVKENSNNEPYRIGKNKTIRMYNYEQNKII